jgi:hypothetical protein
MFEALWLSVRTYPCNGVLHMYGTPKSAFMGRAQRSEDSDLVEAAQTWEVCPVNPSTQHMIDRVVARMATRCGIIRNIWGDTL